MKRKLILVLGLFAIASISLSAIVWAATTIVVTPTSLSGWEVSNFDASTSMATGTTPTASGTNGFFAQGPGTPPAGSGSFHQVMGTNGDDAQRIRTSNFNGMPLKFEVRMRWRSEE